MNSLLDSMTFQFVKKSSNTKLGTIPQTSNSRKTCPKNCIFRKDNGGGCYAEAGYYTKLNWNHLDNKTRGGSFENLINSIKSLKDGQLWRHTVQGDFPGYQEKYIDSDYIKAVTTANTNKNGYGYTHYPLNSHNLELLKESTEKNFIINISTEQDQTALKAIKNGLNSVIVLKSTETRKKFKTKNGLKVIVCPQQLDETKTITCADCKICSKDRDFAVGFIAHGNQAKKIDVILDNI